MKRALSLERARYGDECIKHRDADNARGVGACSEVAVISPLVLKAVWGRAPAEAGNQDFARIIHMIQKHGCVFVPE